MAANLLIIKSKLVGGYFTPTHACTNNKMSPTHRDDDLTTTIFFYVLSKKKKNFC